MTTLQTIWLGIGLGLLSLIMIAWLKGAFGLAAAMARKFAHEFGESWTLASSGEPFVAIVVVFGTAAFGLAHPQSRWARWFYGDDRMAKARERYTEDNA